MNESWVVKMPMDWEPGDCPKCTKGFWCKFYSATDATDPGTCPFGSAERETPNTLANALSERSQSMESR